VKSERRIFARGHTAFRQSFGDHATIGEPRNLG
jgi:hypothetical protein